MREVLLVAACGAVGSLARYGLSEWLARRTTFPYATLVVNVTGSFVLGLVLGLALAGKLSQQARAAVGAGFLGAYTTFSTFSVETVTLVKEGRHGAAAANLALNLGLGLAAAWLGLVVAPRPDV
jgi:CrcB protein